MTEETVVTSEKRRLPRIVSLFSDAGGLDLGFTQADFEVAFAIDISPSAIETHAYNFPRTKSVAADLVDLGPEGLAAMLTEVLEEGDSIGIIGGPPCQGFSQANRSPIPNDPRNELPILYLKIVEELKKQYDVQFVLFENVRGIRDVKHSDVFTGILSQLRDMEFHGRAEDVCALDFGVPQSRRRVIISGFKSEHMLRRFVVDNRRHDGLTVEKAIGHLREPMFYRRDIDSDTIPCHPNHWTMRLVS